MGTIWVISDTHFNHSNILTFMDEDGKRIRPFDSIDQMNELIFDNWSDTVHAGDTVYHLGDVYFGNHDDGGKILSKLPGRKRLVIGNHDDVINIAKRGMFQKMMTWRVFPEWGVILSHIPLHPNNLHIMKLQSMLMNVHGHIHQNSSPPGPYINVSVEATNYNLMNLEELVMR